MSQLRKRSSVDHLDSASRPSEDSNQDWVCLKCNNLNFSFRKKCNRCKIQSRQDNQQLIYADYYYYNHYYAYQHSSPQKLPKSNSNTQKAIEEIHSPQKMTCSSQGELGCRQNDHLPSVSPLVKKYRAGKTKCQKSKGSVFLWKLFEADSWSEEELPAVISPNLSKDLSLTDDQQPSQQFAKNVEKMII